MAEYAKSTTPNNLSYLLTALLPNENGALPAGLSGCLFFDMPKRELAEVSVPQSSLCHRPELGAYVWILDPESKRVEARRVTPGKLLPKGLFSLSQGVQAGERVITSGTRFLSEGMTVAVDSAPHVEPIEM